MAEILSAGNSHRALNLWVFQLKQLRELLALEQGHEPETISVSIFGE